MKADTIHKGLRLADTLAGLIRTTALTVGPPLLRYAGDQQGRMFTGIVKEPERAAQPEPKRIHPFGTAISYVCAHCRSPDVRIAAYAQWSPDDQKWECVTTYQRDAECAHCGTGVEIMPRPVSAPHA